MFDEEVDWSKPYTWPRPLRKFLELASFAMLLFAAGAVLLCMFGVREDVFQADAAVVLGSTVDSDGTPSKQLTARLDRAVELYETGMCPVIIVSGSRSAEGVETAEVMAAYLTRQGIPPEAVVEDFNGVNTQATANFTADWLAANGGESVIAVSQYFHMPRVRKALAGAGVAQVGSAPVDYWELRDFYAIPREVAAYIVYYLR